MSIFETSEDGKDIVTQANSGTGQKLSNWKEYEDKKLSELLGCTQVFHCLFYAYFAFIWVILMIINYRLRSARLLLQSML